MGTKSETPMTNVDFTWTLDQDGSSIYLILVSRRHEEHKINSVHSAAYGAIRFFISVSTTFNNIFTGKAPKQ